MFQSPHRCGKLIQSARALAGLVLILGMSCVARAQCLLEENQKISDYFGPVSMMGSTAVVADGGDAHVFQRISGVWTFLATLTIPGDPTSVALGYSSSLGRQVVVVGGDGSAFVFEEPGSGWVNMTVETAELTPSDPANSGWFGYSVAISNDTIVVGDPDYDNGCAGCPDSGGVYVYEKPDDLPPNNHWADATETVPVLTSPMPGTNHVFGYSLDISSDTIVVGAPGIDQAFVIERAGTGWEPPQPLVPTRAFGLFGYSVAIDGDSAIVGRVFTAPSAHIFERDFPIANAWAERKEVTAPVADGGEYPSFSLFGYDVDIDGDTAVVGAVGSDAACCTGPACDCDAGSAYVFKRNLPAANAWGRFARLNASDAQAGDAFGRSVAVSGESILCAGGGDVYAFFIPDNMMDCNANNIPDGCDIASGMSTDINSNGVPDECEMGSDCNENGIPDLIDIAAGVSQDCDDTAIPDECECLCDVKHCDGVVNTHDLLAVIAAWGPCPLCREDVSPYPNPDGIVNNGDLLTVVANWGTCLSASHEIPQWLQACLDECGTDDPECLAECIGLNEPEE